MYSVPHTQKIRLPLRRPFLLWAPAKTKKNKTVRDPTQSINIYITCPQVLPSDRCWGTIQLHCTLFPTLRCSEGGSGIDNVYTAAAFFWCHAVSYKRRESDLSFSLHCFVIYQQLSRQWWVKMRWDIRSYLIKQYIWLPISYRQTADTAERSTTS